MSLDLTLDLSQFKIGMPKSPICNIYEFDNFRLDEGHLLLYKHGREIVLAPKVVETLLILVKNAGNVITKDKLMSEVWPGTNGNRRRWPYRDRRRSNVVRPFYLRLFRLDFGYADQPRTFGNTSLSAVQINPDH